MNALDDDEMVKCDDGYPGQDGVNCLRPVFCNIFDKKKCVKRGSAFNHDTKLSIDNSSSSRFWLTLLAVNLARVLAALKLLRFLCS